MEEELQNNRILCRAVQTRAAKMKVLHFNTPKHLDAEANRQEYNTLAIVYLYVYAWAGGGRE